MKVTKVSKGSYVTDSGFTIQINSDCNWVSKKDSVKYFTCPTLQDSIYALERYLDYNWVQNIIDSSDHVKVRLYTDENGITTFDVRAYKDRELVIVGWLIPMSAKYARLVDRLTIAFGTPHITTLPFQISLEFQPA